MESEMDYLRGDLSQESGVSLHFTPNKHEEQNKNWPKNEHPDSAGGVLASRCTWTYNDNKKFTQTSRHFMCPQKFSKNKIFCIIYKKDKIYPVLEHQNLQET
jgi:hypothetical protein